MFLSVMATLVAMSSVAQASDAFEGAVNGDYNVGGGVLVSGDVDPAAGQLEAAGGVVGQTEAVGMGLYEGKHLFVFDGRLLTFVAGGMNVQSGGQPLPIFALRLMGSLSTGVQAFQLVPINLSAEDAELDVRGANVTAKALLGTTIYLPIAIWSHLSSTNLYLAITPGARVNTDAPETAFAVQAKLRFLSDKFSGEARVLHDFGSRSDETKGALQLGVNHLVMKGDQLGVYLAASRYESLSGGGTRTLLEAVAFYGGDL